MNAKEIQDILLKDYYQRGHSPLCTNFIGAGFKECDIISVSKSDYIYEFEIKISRSDFKKEFNGSEDKRWKHKKMENPHIDTYSKIANYFYFVCPENLISLNEVPEYSGLIYILDNGCIELKERTIKTIKSAPLIHKIKAEGKLIRRIAQTLSAKQIFGCSYMSYKVKQHREKFKTI